MKNAPETLVLRRQWPRLSRRDLAIMAVILAAGFAGVIWLLAGSGADWAALGAKLLRGSGELALELLGGVAAGWYVMRATRYERLILDRSGIRYQSPLPAGLAAVQPSWSHSWAQIRSAEINVSSLAHPNLVAVVLDVVTAKRKIGGRWVLADREAVIEDAVARDVEQSPLVEFMRRMGVKVAVQPGRGGFALESNRTAWILAVAMIALLLYAVADFAINTEKYAVTPPLVLFVLAGAIAFLFGSLVLARSGVPRAETFGVALLFGGAVGAALFPGALRLNQLTDTDGLQGYQYRMKAVAVWEPRDTSLPELTFADYYEYWGEFKPGAQKEFLLRRGGLGFFQVEMAPVHAEMKAYYRRNP